MTERNLPVVILSSVWSMDALTPDFPNKLHYSTTLPCPHDTQTAICVVCSENSSGKAFWVANDYFFKTWDSKRRSFHLKNPQESHNIPNIFICV